MKKKFIILVFHKGEAERFLFFKFAKTEKEAFDKAKWCIHNTIGYQAIVFLWNKKYGIAEERIMAFSTCGKKRTEEREYEYLSRYSTEECRNFYEQVTPRLDPEKPIVIKEIEKNRNEVEE